MQKNNITKKVLLLRLYIRIRRENFECFVTNRINNAEIMKILCETQVVNRQLPNVKTKSVKATLAIGFHPPSKENAELFIIHFTSQHKTGFRYKVKDNLEKVFTKFIQDGKATISFKIPEHNLLIKCDPIQLKCFLQTMKLGIEGKSKMNKLGLSSLASTPVPQKLYPITTFNITRRGDYPLKGFPRTLKSLTITGIQRMKVDTQIFSLLNLTTLNLSENCISQIPVELGRLSLFDVDLSSNLLGDSVKQANWDWLTKKPLNTTLTGLNLSNNKLSNFPYKLVKLSNLVTLKLNNNKITRIPFAIRRLGKLRFLHLSSNKLESLPQTLTLLRLSTLDVWGNNFQPKSDLNPQISSSCKDVSPLWEIAARNVVAKRLPYNPKTLPWILIEVLSETPICFCGRLCVSSNILERVALLDLKNVQDLIFSREQAIYADSVICSAKCAGKYL